MTPKELTYLTKIGYYLNNHDSLITPAMVRETMDDCGMESEEAFQTLFAGALDLFDDRTFLRGYLPYMVKELSVTDYAEDSYLKTVKFPKVKGNNWEFEEGTYEPYQAFVYRDFREMAAGRVIPQIGYFPEMFSYPKVSQNGREWMAVIPNEIETMRAPIREASGKVLTYGLGLGYFAFHAAEKDEVESVTVIEKDPEVISLFNKYLLSQFPNSEKIKILQGDALEYASSAGNYDFVFADIWHDVSDGLPLYKELKKREVSGPTYRYWIYDTMKHYLHREATI